MKGNGRSKARIVDVGEDRLGYGIYLPTYLPTEVSIIHELASRGFFDAELFFLEKKQNP